MSSANLDLVRSIYRGWERGDFAMADWAHPEIEFVLADGPMPGSSKGVAEMAAIAGEGLDAWEDARIAPEEYRELDDETVLALDSRHGRGKTSGVELPQVQSLGAHLFRIRQGKVVKLINYWDRSRALVELGLAPDRELTPADKLALARRSYAAFSDGPDIAAILPLYHAECEWRMGYAGAALGTEAFCGHDGLRAFVSALVEGFDRYSNEIDEARISRDGLLLLHGHVLARSRGTHLELSMEAWQEIAFREGLAFTVTQLATPPVGWDDATPLG
jgi:ketosteroid isomerase-like protein